MAELRNMVVFPPAKLNLGLFVTGKRADGFHALESVFVPIDWYDVLELTAADAGAGPGLTTAYSGLAIPPSNSANLIERAYAAMRATGASLPPLHAHLHKVLPMGAGLGGGSSDGAWMLRALNSWAGLNAGQLHAAAAELGSDCPFFLHDGPAFVHGRGEHLEPVATGSWQGWPIAVVHPGAHVSTGAAFARVKVRPAPMDLRGLPELPVEDWHAAGVANAFQPGVAAQVPLVADALEHVAPGATYHQMTGTGSAVFALYPDDARAVEVADRAKQRGWSAWSGRL